MIAFSGLDGAGKSTQIELLNKYLEQKKNKTYVFWSRGGYTPIFNFFKKIFLSKKNENIKQKKEESIEKREKVLSSPLVRRLWLTIAILDLIFYYAVYIRYKEIFGYTIICDRYIIDTEIDFELNFPDEKVRTWLLWKLLLLFAVKPEKHFVFTISVDESRIRSVKKKEPFPDSKEVLVKRLDIYMKFVKDNNYVVHLSGMNSIEELHAEILKKINLL